jgi:predicted nucleotidyltransferase component of viral defense system
MIPQKNLSLLSNRLAKEGGRRIPETILERDYCLSWFLVGLSRTSLRDRLAFKGGTALKKCYFGDYRFSEDLDFTLYEETLWDDIQRELYFVFKQTQEASGVDINLDRMDRHQHQNSHTFYLTYEGPLPRTREKTVKVDITIREQIVFSLMDCPILHGYKEYEDLPEDAILRAYSLDEIAVEKIIALLDRARNEPRDLYDIWYLVTNGYVRLSDLYNAIEKKLAFRESNLEQVSDVFEIKEARYKKLWGIRLATQMTSLPEFDTVYRAVRRSLRQTGITRKR